jgi:hypothetical protein
MSKVFEHITFYHEDFYYFYLRNFLDIQELYFTYKRSQVALLVEFAQDKSAEECANR